MTGWAALRWHGAAFFDGTAGPSEWAPVELVTGGRALRADPRVAISAAQLAPEERQLIDGLWVTSVERALFDSVRRRAGVREAVVDVESTLAAGLLSLGQLTGYIACRNAWTGVGMAREATTLAGLGTRTPQETRMALTWILDAGLPRPQCNRPVFDLRGNLVAMPDLLDVEAGCVGEYQGAHHKDREQHRADVARADRLRAVGLESFEVVGGDLEDRDLVVKRMREARDRARFAPAHERAWTLEQPSWWPTWAASRGIR